MEINFRVVKASDLKDGDVFYCTPSPKYNEYGPNFLVTGTDQIFIKDDDFGTHEDGVHSVVVNGGHIIWFEPEDQVIVLTHYSELLRVLDMVKEGNPNLNIGANDFHTLLDEAIESEIEVKSPLDEIDSELEFHKYVDDGFLLDLSIIEPSAIILNGTDAYYKWANSLGGPITEPSFDDGYVLLLDDIEMEEEVTAYVEGNHQEILEHFFMAMWTDESAWPKERDMNAFNKFIKWSYSSMVLA